MVEHPVFKARLQLLINEFHLEAENNQEWVEWKKKYKSWNGTNLDSYGVRRGDHYVWVLTNHPVMDLVRCNVNILTTKITNGVWQELDSALFDCCCQTLRSRFDFLRTAISVLPET